MLQDSRMYIHSLPPTSASILSEQGSEYYGVHSTIDAPEILTHPQKSGKSRRLAGSYERDGQAVLSGARRAAAAVHVHIGAGRDLVVHHASHPLRNVLPTLEPNPAGGSISNPVLIMV